MCIECCCIPIGQDQGHGHKQRFLTKAEKVEKLKNYTQELKKELTAVEENIKELSN